jgi:hypothetical protein
MVFDTDTQYANVVKIDHQLAMELQLTAIFLVAEELKAVSYDDAIVRFDALDNDVLQIFLGDRHVASEMVGVHLGVPFHWLKLNAVSLWYQMVRPSDSTRTGTARPCGSVRC